MALLPTGVTAGQTGHVADSNQIHRKLNALYVDVVADFGAAGNGVADDTSAIQAAINALPTGGGIVYFPTGTYKLTSAVTLRSKLALVGDGPGTIIYQDTAAAHCFSGSAIQYLTIRDMYLQAVGGGAGDGINITKGGNAAVLYVDMADVTMDSFRDGVSIENAIVSTLRGVKVQGSNRYGINLYGQVAGAAGTSVVLDACYGNGCTTAGYRIYNMTYLALNGCAADSCGVGYLLDTCFGVSLSGCGGETNTTNTFKISGGYGVSLLAPFVFDNFGVGIYITGTATGVSLIGAVDNSPHAGATNFIKVDSGSSVAMLNCSNVSANSLAAGTTSTLTDTSGGALFRGYTVLNGGGECDSDFWTFTGDLKVGTAGFGLRVKEGSNAKMGVSGAMTAGTITISTTAVTATSRIFLTAQSTGGTAGALRVSARTAGTSFVITSTSGTDTSTVAWMLVEPA